MEAPKRYHPLLVTLHWLVAALVTVDLYLGLFVLRIHEHTDLIVAVHMTTGLSVLALLIVRFATRMTTARPAPATSGSGLLDGLADGVHSALYLMLATITIIGVALAWQTGHFQEIYLGAGEAAPAVEEHAHTDEAHAAEHEGLPEPSSQIPAGSDLTRLHLGNAYILLALIGMHMAAAGYHQCVRRDGLLARMWYGSR